MREVVENKVEITKQEARELVERCLKVLYYRDARSYNRVSSLIPVHYSYSTPRRLPCCWMLNTFGVFVLARDCHSDGRRRGDCWSPVLWNQLGHRSHGQVGLKVTGGSYEVPPDNSPIIVFEMWRLTEAVGGRYNYSSIVFAGKTFTDDIWTHHFFSFFMNAIKLHLRMILIIIKQYKIGHKHCLSGCMQIYNTFWC